VIEIVGVTDDVREIVGVTDDVTEIVGVEEGEIQLETSTAALCMSSVQST